MTQSTPIFFLAITLIAFDASAESDPSFSPEHKSLTAQVVGGSVVPDGVLPEIAEISLRLDTGDIAHCTGVLVAPDVVLTAQHCVLNSEEITKVVIAGEEHQLASATPYPNFDADVAVLMLDQPSQVAPRVVASGCASENFVQPGAPARVAGYGQLGADLDRMGLQQAPLMITAIEPGWINAKGEGTSACFGDSGGPLYIDTPAGPLVAGLVSGGNGEQPCVGENVFSAIDEVVTWIETSSGRSLPQATCNTPPTLSATETELAVAPGETTEVTLNVDDVDSNDAHHFQVLDAPTHGSAEITEDGELLLTMNAEFNGEDEFVVAVSDTGIPSADSELRFTVVSAQSGGCSSAGGGASSTASFLLALALLGYRLRRRLSFAALTLFTLAACSTDGNMMEEEEARSPDAGTTDTQPDADTRNPVECDAPAAYAAIGEPLASALGIGDEIDFNIALSTQLPDNALLDIVLVGGRGIFANGVEALTYDLSLDTQGSAECGACLSVLTAGGQQYTAVAGQLRIDEFTVNAQGGSVTGAMTDVSFALANPLTGVVEDAECTTALAGAEFDSSFTFEDAPQP